MRSSSSRRPPPRPRKTITRRAKQCRFGGPPSSEPFAHLGNIKDAAAAAGVHRNRHYDWLNDPTDRDDFNKAVADFKDRVRSKLHEGALQGFLVPVYRNGRRVFVPRKVGKGRKATTIKEPLMHRLPPSEGAPHQAGGGD